MRTKAVFEFMPDLKMVAKIYSKTVKLLKSLKFERKSSTTVFTCQQEWFQKRWVL
jgi:hypothetical protein